jgi:starch synthase
LFLAAENGAIPGAKVGGLADVIRDVPKVLSTRGIDVDVVIPSYGFLHRQAPADRVADLTLGFSGREHSAAMLRLRVAGSAPRVRHFLIDHPWFGPADGGHGPPSIYSIDPPQRPFATDATKFTLFCTAAAAAVRENVLETPDRIHLHDWHMAFFLVLRKYDPAFQSALSGVRTVFTIHNLALQGIRPLDGDASSLRAWCHELNADRADLADPRWPDCVNLMAAGIRLADAVHVVSPSYAEEILLPSDPPRFYGGEGLEADLRAARGEGRLAGILNGCPYPEEKAARIGFQALLERLRSQAASWIDSSPSAPLAHLLAFYRLHSWAAAPAPAAVVTSVTRTVEQKMLLMRAVGTDGRSGLEAVLGCLQGRGVYILLGCGDPDYDAFFTEAARRHDHFLFLNGYSDACADTLYANGDLFLMPSSFEPCGISQMLAMRAGQPCLVHHVGGLKDTVADGVDGLAFTGESVIAQVDRMALALRRALDLMTADPAGWERLCRAAAAARFRWEDAIEAYCSQLYR